VSIVVLAVMMGVVVPTEPTERTDVTARVSPPGSALGAHRGGASRLFQLRIKGTADRGGVDGGHSS